MWNGQQDVTGSQGCLATYEPQLQPYVIYTYTVLYTTMITIRPTPSPFIIIPWSGHVGVENYQLHTHGSSDPARPHPTTSRGLKSTHITSIIIAEYHTLETPTISKGQRGEGVAPL